MTLGLLFDPREFTLAETREGRIVHTAREALPAEADAELQERAGLQALRRVVARRRLAGASTIIGLTDPQAVVRTLTLPQMPRDELVRVAAEEARRALPWAETPMELRPRTGRVRRHPDGSRLQEVVIAACPTAAAERILSLVAASGLRPVTLVPFACAVETLLQHTSSPAASPRMIWCHLGLASTHFVLTAGDRIVTASGVPTGVAHLESRLLQPVLAGETLVGAGAVQTAWFEKEWGIPASSDGPAFVGRLSSAEALDRVQPVLDTWVAAVHQLLSQGDVSWGGSPEPQMALSGRGSAIPGLADYFHRALGLPVRVIPDGAGRLAGALAKSGATSMNLAPSAWRLDATPARATPVRRSVLIAAAMALGLAWLVGWAAQAYWTVVITAQQTQAGRFSELATWQTQMSRRVRLISQLHKGLPSVEEWLTAIRAAIPPSVTIRSWAWFAGTGELRLTAQLDEAKRTDTSRQVIDQGVAAIRRLPGVASAELGGAWGEETLSPTRWFEVAVRWDAIGAATPWMASADSDDRVDPEITVQRDLRSLNARFVSPAQWAIVLRRLQLAAQPFGVRMVSVSRHDHRLVTAMEPLLAAERLHCVEWPATLEVTGRPQALARYVDALRRQPVLLAVHAVEMTSSPDRPETASGRIQLSAYQLDARR